MDTSTPVGKFFKLSKEQKSGLEKINLLTLQDVLDYFPMRYGLESDIRTIQNIQNNEYASVYGKLKSIEASRTFRTKILQSKGIIEDIHNNQLHAIWFNQQYIAKMYQLGDYVKITGTVKINGKGEKTIVNGEIEKIKELPIDAHDSLFENEQTEKLYGYPVYKETKGVTSKWIYHAIKKILKDKIHEMVLDPIDPDILAKYNLPKKSTAYIWIHMPQNEKHKDAARKRFAFEEMFKIQLVAQYEKSVLAHERAYPISKKITDIHDFIETFPFGATKSQQNAVDAILHDMSREYPMSRLIEGDVGSGKTFVSACAAYSVITTRPKNQSFGTLQVAYMAPTEILAIQQFESFCEYFNNTGISLGLLTGKTCRKFPSKIEQRNNKPTWTSISKTQLTKWVSQGEISIIIGTHSLIQKNITFKHLALAIIDEQHRFGRNQRKGLAKKDSCMPHLLSMTATPIPRTLALTLYGGLDVTLLQELPKGRKQVDTKIVLPPKRAEMYDFIKEKLREGRQVYVICPRIDEPDESKQAALITRSVVQEVKKLGEEIFKEYIVAPLHSKMTKQEKEETMREFAENKIQILVATSVVEVGVNVPNATVIVIEGAERFGLSQLHQLRGRVQRSNEQPYCFLFCESKNEKTLTRMKHFISAKNGFELAEFDLETRGPGELIGQKQWGLSDIGMIALKNMKLVEAAQNEAKVLIEKGYVPEHYTTHHFE